MLTDALAEMSSRIVREDHGRGVHLPQVEFVDDDPMRIEAVLRARKRSSEKATRRTSPPRGRLWSLLVGKEESGLISVTFEAREMVLTVRPPNRPPMEFKFPRGMGFRNATNHPNSPDRRSLYQCLAVAFLPRAEDDANGVAGLLHHGLQLVFHRRLDARYAIKPFTSGSRRRSAPGCFRRRGSVSHRSEAKVGAPSR